MRVRVRFGVRVRVRVRVRVGVRIRVRVGVRASVRVGVRGRGRGWCWASPALVLGLGVIYLQVYVGECEELALARHVCRRRCEVGRHLRELRPDAFLG